MYLNTLSPVYYFVLLNSKLLFKKRGYPEGIHGIKMLILLCFLVWHATKYSKFFISHFIFNSFLKYRWHKWLKFLVTVKDFFHEEAAGFLLAFDRLMLCVQMNRMIPWEQMELIRAKLSGSMFYSALPPYLSQRAAHTSPVGLSNILQILLQENSLWMAHQKNNNVDSQRKTWHAGKSFSSEMDPDLHLILNILTRPTSFVFASFPFH